jgi:RNA polymerase sigma factor (sigma-70 family)
MPRGRSDDALVARVRAGDDRAFELIFDRYHRGLLAFCAHMLGNRDEAEDALQHSFMAAYRAMRATDGEIRLKAWLYTIARNRCLSVLRARREHVAFDETRAATDGLAADVDRRAELRGLLADLERLPEEQRAALVLFELGDHAHDEIAEILGVRREKVKALVFQARESLASWRRARETPCAEIREQLATLRGAALKRATLRRHIARCESCRGFEAEVRHQRKAMAAALPIVPTAGLKAAVLASVLDGGSAAAGGGGAALAGLGAAKGLAAKTMLCAAVAGSAGSAGYVAVHDIDARMHTPPGQAQAANHPRARHAKPKRATPVKQVVPATVAVAATAAPAKPARAAHAQRAKDRRAWAGHHRGHEGFKRWPGARKQAWRGKRDAHAQWAAPERSDAGRRGNFGADGQRGERGSGERGGSDKRSGWGERGDAKDNGWSKRGGGDRHRGGGGSRHAGVSPR